MTLYVVRHGQTDWNREPARCQGWAEVELNELGRAQARERGRALVGEGIELVVSSHLRRAVETAQLVREELEAAGGHELPLIADPRLAETHRGDWEMRLYSEIMQEEPLTWRAYREHPESFRFPNGESLLDQQRRVLAAVRDAARDGRRTVLVTHGGSIRLLRCFLGDEGIGGFHRMAARNGAVEHVPLDGLAPRLDTFLAAP